MPNEEKKGITVKIDAELHAEVKQFLESHGLTMAEFVTQALQDELHPQHNIQEEKSMGNMRTMAFQVPEELFQKIKDYLQRNNMTQKQFVIGLIETEINRDLTQRAAEAEQRKSTTVCAREGSFKHSEGSDTEEQTESDFEGVSDGEGEEAENEDLGDEEAEDLDDELSKDEEPEDEDLDEDESESEEQGMSMGM